MLNAKNTLKFQMSLQDTEILLLQLQNDSVSCEDKNDSNFWYSGVCYNQQFYNIRKLFLSIKSGCYNEHICYNKRGGILSADVARVCTWHVYIFTGEDVNVFHVHKIFYVFTVASSIIVFPTERLFKLFTCVRLFMLFMCVRLFMLFKFTCTVYKSSIN